jgi:hypothetical protein
VNATSATARKSNLSLRELFDRTFCAQFFISAIWNDGTPERDWRIWACSSQRLALSFHQELLTVIEKHGALPLAYTL